MRQRARRLVNHPVTRRVGGGAFVFFLVKGLLWVAVPAVLALWATAP